MRGAVRKIHLILGLAAGLFLVVLGLTGSIIAFENDLDHWFHPALWYVNAGSRPLTEQDLIDKVNAAHPSGRVVAVQHFRDPRLVRAMRTSDGITILISPYDGHVTGQFQQPSATVLYVGYVHQLHMRLVPDPRAMKRAAAVGEDVVLGAGYLACFLIPTGIVLWWRAKRATIKWGAPVFRLVFDTHNALGIFAGVFLFIAALTGVMVENEPVYFALAGSGRPGPLPKITSEPVPGAVPITADQAIAAAGAALRGATVQAIQLPGGPKGVFSLAMLFAEDSSETAHSPVIVDQYSGQVRFARNFLTDSPGFRIVRFNRAIHTGDSLGGFGHALMSLASIAFVVMTVTGWLIWWKKARS
jgi:uncharacterized iron-regulated membrane protein